MPESRREPKLLFVAGCVVSAAGAAPCSGVASLTGLFFASSARTSKKDLSSFFVPLPALVSDAACGLVVCGFAACASK